CCYYILPSFASLRPRVSLHRRPQRFGAWRTLTASYLAGSVRVRFRGMTLALSVERRAWRSWWLPDRDDETCPQTSVVAAVIFLIDVCERICLQDDWTKALTDQSADGDLALLLVTRDRRIEVRGPEGDQPELPLTELPASRQIDIQEVGIAPVQRKGRWARRQLRASGNVIEVRAPDHIRGQVQAIAGITEGEPLIERGRTPSDFTFKTQIGTEQVAEAPIVSQIPRQLARDERIVDAAQIGRTVDTDLDHGTRNQELYPAAEDHPWGRPGQDRNVDSDRCVEPTSIAPVPGIDEIKPLGKWSASRETHSFTRLGHRAGEGRGGDATRQRSGCRQFHKLAVHCYLPRQRNPVAGF